MQHVAIDWAGTLPAKVSIKEASKLGPVVSRVCNLKTMVSVSSIFACTCTVHIF